MPSRTTITRATWSRRRALGLLGALAAPLCLPALGGCAGFDLFSVSSLDPALDPATPVPAGQAVLQGRLRFVVDGEPMRYHLLNRPALQLFDRGSGLMRPTPEADGEGRFAWRLPAGDYGVAVIFGGMVPAQQPHHMPSGALVFVNGLVDPGLEFRVAAGAHVYVGTVEVRIESRPARHLPLDRDGRIFGRLLGIGVFDESAAEFAGRPVPPVALMQRATARRTG